MKVLIVFAVAAASANAGVLLSSGNSVQQRSEDGLGNYAFGYNEQHSTGGSSRQESGSPGVKVGSYSLNVADGRQRVVNYVADGAGFRASIATNEQGTAPSLPAAAAYNAASSLPAPIAAVATPIASAATAVAAPISTIGTTIAAAPIAAANAIAAPIAAAFPVAAPVAAPAYAAAPIALAKSTAYSTAVNHGAIHAAPVAVAAPAYASIAAPAYASIAAPAIAAPAAYAANVYAPSGAWAHGLYGYGYNTAVRAW